MIILSSIIHWEEELGYTFFVYPASFVNPPNAKDRNASERGKKLSFLGWVLTLLCMFSCNSYIVTIAILSIKKKNDVQID